MQNINNNGNANQSYDNVLNHSEIPGISGLSGFHIEIK
jgi:hypothetical protein